MCGNTVRRLYNDEVLPLLRGADASVGSSAGEGKESKAPATAAAKPGTLSVRKKPATFFPYALSLRFSTALHTDALTLRHGRQAGGVHGLGGVVLPMLPGFHGGGGYYGYSDDDDYDEDDYDDMGYGFGGCVVFCVSCSAFLFMIAFLCFGASTLVLIVMCVANVQPVWSARFLGRRP